MARGILPLACYDGVSEPPAGADGSAGSTPDGLHAFQLTASDGSPERAFVLAPLQDLDASIVLPTGENILSLLANCSDQGIVKL